MIKVTRKNPRPDEREREIRWEYINGQFIIALTRRTTERYSDRE